ncbi:hypothetical protein E4P29_03430 [Rhodococcus sp. 1R11]|nr:hypothetical protein E4P29_03430 [Rhodococcus sp. 1R11]
MYGPSRAWYYRKRAESTKRNAAPICLARRRCDSVSPCSSTRPSTSRPQLDLFDGGVGGRSGVYLGPSNEPFEPFLMKVARLFRNVALSRVGTGPA